MTSCKTYGNIGIQSVLLIAFMLLVFVTGAKAQQKAAGQQAVLVLKNTKKGKGNMLKQKRKIKVWVSGADSPVKGRFVILDEDTIEIKEQIIPLGDVTKIKHRFLPTYLVGGVFAIPFTVFTGIGAGLVISGIVQDDGYQLVFGLLLGIFSSVPTAAFWAVHHINRTYKLDNHWEVAVQQALSSKKP